MNQPNKCKIVSVGKRRDGGTRYWCLEHKGDATAKYGRRARRCRYSHIAPLMEHETLRLDIDGYEGGVSVWGAVPPIYDTTRQPMDRGVHVHARSARGEKKKIDQTYRAVHLVSSKRNSQQASLIISELDAIYYMVTTVFGFSMRYVECLRCGFPHLDKDWFSLHAHHRHLCAGCGHLFRDTESGIGNPAVRAQEIFGNTSTTYKSAGRTINFNQKDYPGGIQIWGSNPAILWTAPQQEETGIHIHAMSEDGKEILIDETFSEVTVDGIGLEPESIRVFMAQRTLPHLSHRIVNIICERCNEPHFDTGEFAYTPHEIHMCMKCGFETRNKGRLRKTIGNPIVGVLAYLGLSAPRAPQDHQLNLLTETL